MIIKQKARDRLDRPYLSRGDRTGLSAMRCDRLGKLTARSLQLTNE
ncbi:MULTISPECIES: hypothetical protein [unclassified Microcoleus]